MSRLWAGFTAILMLVTIGSMVAGIWTGDRRWWQTALLFFLFTLFSGGISTQGSRDDG